jgi:hypothetical protein
MSDISDDRLELLERQLAEKVTARVRPALFKLYAAVGAAVIAVLGFVSWDIVSDIKNEIKNEIRTEIDSDIESKRDEIIDRLAEIRFMANRANEIIQRVEQQLDAFRPQAESLDETIRKVSELQVTSRDLIDAYSRELKPLVENVEDFSEHLALLAEQVDQLNTIATGVEAASVGPQVPTQEQRSEAIKSVISESKQAQQQLAQSRSKTTVFIQYSGGSSEQAAEIAGALRSGGFNVPAIDQDRNASRQHQVRYFHQDDKAAANRLAEQVNNILKEMNLWQQDRPVTSESFVAYKGLKPRPGVVELWLQIGSELAY